MKKMICFLIANLSNSGGTQRILTCLCNLLIEDYNIIIMVNQSEDSFFPLDSRVKIIDLSSKKENLLSRNIRIYKILKKYNIQYYINLDTNSVIANSLFLPKFTKLICWEHFSLSTNYQKIFFTLSRFYGALRAHTLVLLSKHEVQAWKDFSTFVKGKAKLVYNPITVEYHLNSKINKKDLKTFLAVGNNIDVKGFDILLEAWALQSSDWSLQIVGLIDVDLARMCDLVKEKDLKNVKLFGRINNIHEFYQNSSVFILSSRKEATPLVLLESQAFGLPAIIFNHLTSALELIDNSAILIDYDLKEHALAKAINEIGSNGNLYNELFKNSLENAKRFSEEKFKQKWLELLV
ncbi:glycosyltransferase [Acinetobacter sp. ANC 5383]